jgi:glycerol-3-phosphate acyltransferase PlsY
MRAAGFGAGLLTAILDFLKSAVTVWVARGLMPEAYWLHILAPLAAILGHNYSVFLTERGQNGKLRLRGGAGGAPAAGGALGLWAPTFLVILPVALVVLFIIGYASLATLSVGVIATLVLAYRAWMGVSPWQYILYGVLAEVLLIWALRPNIRRLLGGSERRIGFFARKSKRKPTPPEASTSNNERTTNIITS